MTLMGGARLATSERLFEEEATKATLPTSEVAIQRIKLNDHFVSQSGYP
jgi:hypothetical protein